MLDLLWRSSFRFGLRPLQVTGDTTYGTVENIVAIEDSCIRAYVPLPDFDGRTPFFGKGEFTYDAEADAYICPQGRVLPWRKNSYTERMRIYQAEAATCHACSLRDRCTAGSKGRQIKRSFDESYMEHVRTYHKTEAYQNAIRKRSVWVEPLFAEAKLWHRMTRFRLRRLQKVDGEALIAATGQNIKRLLSKWG